VIRYGQEWAFELRNCPPTDGQDEETQCVKLFCEALAQVTQQHGGILVQRRSCNHHGSVTNSHELLGVGQRSVLITLMDTLELF